MKNLVEQYISQSPGSQAQIDTARKAFKAELKNGPVKSVTYANGIQGQKACGNFDLELYHMAYDAELDADGLLVYFDDNGLINDRRIYPALKQFSSEGAKYAKELWVLQFGQSDYKLVNVPAAAAPMSITDILVKLISDEAMRQVFAYSVADLTFTGGSKFNTCKEVFTEWLDAPDKLEKFLEVTFLKNKPYDVIKNNICAMFLCLAATNILLQKIKTTNKQFEASDGTSMQVSKILVDYNLKYKVPVRLVMSFSWTLYEWPYIMLAFRFLLNAEDKMLDLPVCTSIGSNDMSIQHNIMPVRKKADIPEVTKFSDFNFKGIEQIIKNYC